MLACRQRSKRARAVDGSRFGGRCEVLRDALLWAFPKLPDPFLSFQASTANSSTKQEAALALSILDRCMCQDGERQVCTGLDEEVFRDVAITAAGEMVGKVPGPLAGPNDRPTALDLQNHRYVRS